MSRTLSIGQEHELLQKLESAGLTPEMAHLIITSEGNKLAKKVIDFLKNEIGIKTNSFKVSDHFGHRVEGKIPQWMSDTFLERVFNPCKDMEIILPEVLPTLKEYVLPKNMSDSQIQKNTSSKPMSLEEYFLVRYILLISDKADKNKVYIFHVKVGGVVLALDLYWNGDEWYSHVYTFDDGYDWYSGNVFVSLP